MDLRTIIPIILGIYLAVCIILGIYGLKFVKSFKDFLVVGKRAGMLFLLGAALGNHFGGGFVVGGSEYGATHGLGGAWYGIACGLAYIGFVAIAKKVRQMEALTVSEAMAARYGGHRTRVVFAVLNAIGYTGIMGSQILAGGKILAALGFNPTVGLIVTTLIVIGYSAMSGLWGEMATDVLQVLVGGAGILIAFVYLIATHGTAPLAGLEPGKFAIIPFDTMTFLMILVPTALFGFVSQVTYQRTIAAKNDKISVSHHWIAGLILIPLAYIPVLMGMYGRAFWPDIPAGQALPELMLQTVPPVIAAVVLVAIYAALMSTSDSLLLGVTAHVVYDIYNKVLKPDASERHLLFLSRILSVFIGLGALAFALAASGILSLMILAYSIVVCGSIVAVLGGFAWKKGTEPAAFWSMIVGIAVFLLGRYGVLPIPYPNLVALVPSLAVFIAVSLIWPSANKKLMISK